MKILKSVSVLFASLSVLFPSIVFSAPSDPLQSVPADSIMLLSMDVKKISNLPIIDELKKSNPQFQASMQEIETKLKPHGIKPEDFANKLCVFSSGAKNFGAVFSTAVKESQMESLFNEAMKTNKDAQINTQIISGKKVFILNGKTSMPFAGNNVADTVVAGMVKQREVSALTYVKDDIILLSSEDNIAEIANKIKNANITSNKNLIAKSEKFPKDAPAWMIFQLPPKKENTAPPSSKNPMLANYEEKIRGGAAYLTFSGQAQKDIGLNLELECEDAQTPAMMALQANAFMAMAMPANNPQLAAEVASAIKIQPTENTLTVKVFIPNSLIEKFKELQQQKKSMMDNSATRKKSNPANNSSMTEVGAPTQGK